MVEYKRKIINSLIDTTNVMDFKEFATLANQTLDMLIELILPLCGKYACKNMIVIENINDNISNVVFSNDGIHVLNNVEFLSPIQVYIVNYIKYIASRVESSASDGTSTAIYFACTIMKKLIKQISRSYETNTNNGISGLVWHMKQIKKIHEQFLADMDRLDEIIESLSIDLTELDKHIKERFVYSLAYTTSKNNEPLSRYAVDFFLSAPEELYEYSSFDRALIESDEEFIIEEKEYDFVLNCLTSQNTKYNKSLFTVFDKKCDLLIYYDQPTTDKEFEDLLTFLQSYESKHLVFLYKNLNEIHQRKIESYTDPYNVTICRHTAHTPELAENPIELMTVHAAAGKPDFKDKTLDTLVKLTIKDVRCVITNKSITIYDMIPRTNGHVHPLYLSKESTFYNRLTTDLKNILQDGQDKHVKQNLTFEHKEFIRVYKNLVAPFLPTLKIGGLTTKHMANINVVEDTLGTVSVSMKHGVFIDLFYKLYSIDPKLLPGLKEFVLLTYGHIGTGIYEKFSAITSEGQSCDARHSNETDYVIQSKKAMKELIRRLKEVMTEIIYINKVIVPNGVVQKGESEDGVNK
jgi:hypothetical protein